MQILPQSQSVGSKFGTGLGQGLSQGLQSLANLKAQELMQQKQLQQNSQFWQGLGLPRELAQQFGSAPEAVQKSLLDRLEGLNVSVQQPSVQQGLAALQAPQNAEQQAAVSEIEAARSPQQGVKIGLNPQERRHREAIEEKRLGRELKEKQFETKESRIEQHAIDKSEAPFVKEINTEAKSAKGNNMRLSRMKELISSGNLNGPTWSTLVDTVGKGIFGIGFDMTAALHPDSQEFKKLTVDMLKSAKDTFGSRVTDSDVRIFLSTLPNLSQSTEGQRRVIANLEAFNNAALVRQNALSEVIKENGGRIPRNVEFLVEEKAAPQLDAIADQFKKGLGNPNQTSYEPRISQVLKGDIGALVR